MKVKDLLENRALDDMTNAMADISAKELQKIQDDVVGYYQQAGADISPQEANEAASILGALDDDTFFRVASSPVITSVVGNNYREDTQSSFIDFNTLIDVLSRAKARIQ